MSTFEREVKVLNINVKSTINKLNKLNFEYVGTKNQCIYTYDIMSVYHRFLEIKELLKSKSILIVKTNKKKLMVLLDEFMDLIDDNDLKKIYKEMNIKSFNDFNSIDGKEILKKLNLSNTFKTLIKKEKINPNKWIRLRSSNEKQELTLKHVYEKNNDSIQKVKEVELNVSSIDEMNLFLENIGIVRRNYQEKKRTSYKYKDASIEIDEWPLLEAYMEIECDSNKTIKEILDLLDLNDHEIVSLNTQELYKRKGINILEMDELKF